MKRGGTLARRTGLETRSALRSHSELKTRAALNAGPGPKARQRGAKKTRGSYFSVFTEADVSACAFTGVTKRVEVHHVFGGPYKAASERRGFVIPLERSRHTGARGAVHEDRELSEELKLCCALLYVRRGLGDREDFVREFGRWPQPADKSMGVLRGLLRGRLPE